MKEYEMTEPGIMKLFLGIRVKQSKGDLYFTRKVCLRVVTNISHGLRQKKKKTFHMENSKPVSMLLAVDEELCRMKEHRTLIRRYFVFIPSAWFQDT